MMRSRSALGRSLLLSSLLALPLMVGASAAWAGDAAAGKKNYDMLCFTCHGMTGKGDGPAGGALNPKPRDFSIGDYKYDADKDGTAGTDADMVLIIKNGAAPYGGSPLMAPWSHLSDADIANLVAYVRSLKK